MKQSKYTKNEMHRGNLILVNSEYPVFSPETQRFFPIDKNVMLEQKTAAVLFHLLEEIGSGDRIVPVSGYRSKKEQENIYTESLWENGAEFTRKYVAFPDHSEHQTGLAIDLGLKKEEIDFICPDFPYEGICQTFRETAPEYGFVERYPKGKEAVTGISHEPWHFRYVGFPHSAIMVGNGFTLEEYIGYLKEFTQKGKPLTEVLRGRRFEIFYVPEAEADEILLPEEAVCEVSGTNSGGFVVTVWRESV